MKFKSILGSLLVLAGLGCSQNQEKCEIDPVIEAVQLDLEIVRLEKAFFEDVSKESIKKESDRFREFADAYLLRREYDSEDEFLEAIVQLHADPGMQELYTEVAGYFSDFSDVEQQLEDAFKAIKYHYPDFSPPKVYTFVSGFANDLFLTKEMLVISLDYFLPEDHRFQPLDLPKYITRRYTKEHLVPTIITAISAWYNDTNLNDNTLLAEMIFYGKSYHFTKEMMPCTSDEYIIGYTSAEILASYANEELIYSHFIENELFYETNPFEIRKYTGEAPFTDEISLDAPGRIGRWLGWNIVDDYRINNNLSIQKLMAESDAQKIFRQSGYRPR